MRVYISADIEGVAGIAAWEETTKGGNGYETYALQLTKEVEAACRGAIEAGAQEVYVRDAHDSARNINFNLLPEEVYLQRGWSLDPLCMVSGIDKGFDAAIFIGYHSRAGSSKSPLAHTMNTNLEYIRLNGKKVSEFVINAYAAAYYKIPVVFVSGDKELMEEVLEYNSAISTLATKEGVGDSVVSIHPERAIREIRDEVRVALSKSFGENTLTLPEDFQVEISYKNHQTAYKMSFYPGASLKDEHTIAFKAEDYYEVLRFLHFVS
ncbi:MAG: M55 family metallopeptidase [Clostridiaceae bacterium]